MKKFLSLILTLAMLACMSVTAFASGDSAGTTIVVFTAQPAKGAKTSRY